MDSVKVVGKRLAGGLGRDWKATMDHLVHRLRGFVGHGVCRHGQLIRSTEPCYKSVDLIYLRRCGYYQVDLPLVPKFPNVLLIVICKILIFAVSIDELVSKPYHSTCTLLM